MICTLINHCYHHMSLITFIFLAWSTWGADPPRLALICTDGTPCLAQPHLIVPRGAASEGKSKLSFDAKLLSWRSPCTFHQFTESLLRALLFVFLLTKLQRTRHPPLKTEGVLNTECICCRFSIFSTARQYVCGRVNSQAILKAVAWQVLLIKP